MEEYQLRGWIIETKTSQRFWDDFFKLNEGYSKEEELRMRNRNIDWKIDYKHKIYLTEDIAKDALKQFGEVLYNDYRIKPVYSKIEL